MHAGAGKGRTYVKSQCQCPTITVQQELSMYLRDLLLRDFTPKYLRSYICEVQFSGIKKSLEMVERQKNKKVGTWVYRRRN